MNAGPAVTLLAVTAVLYLAREVLIPLALAIMVAFLLAPAVRLLERLRLGRVLATVIAVLVGFSLVGAVAWVSASQAVSLAADLPQYRANVVKKIRELKLPGGQLERAADAIKDLEREADPAARKPLPVAETRKGILAQFAEVSAPFLKPVGFFLAVLILTILFLLHRENMRERLVALVGAARINVTTQAIDEASTRVSSYLLAQLGINAAFGLLAAIALYFIGLPNALLWGVLATFLRFVPYAGIWVAMALPTLVALAVSPGWELAGWTLGVFLALELVVVNGLEPWLYGRSAGLSPIAVIAAAIFWTWLWGPVGLLLSTPLTVCLSVAARHVPQLEFFNVLLGVEPVLPPEARLYQRLLARDDEEAIDLATAYAAEHGLVALHLQVVIPALALVERDRQRLGAAERTRFVFDTLRRIIDEVEDGKDPRETKDGKEKEARADAVAQVEPAPAAGLVLAAAHDEADHLAALALARTLPRGTPVETLEHPLLAGEAAEQLAARGARRVGIVAVSSRTVRHAGYLAHLLRRQLPEASIVVVLGGREELPRARSRLERSGVTAVAAEPAPLLEQLDRAPGAPA